MTLGNKFFFMLASPEILFCPEATNHSLGCTGVHKSLLGWSYASEPLPLVGRECFLLSSPFPSLSYTNTQLLICILNLFGFPIAEVFIQCPGVPDRPMDRYLGNGIKLQCKNNSSFTFYKPLTKMLTTFP